MTVETVPGFSRIEITTGSKQDLLLAALELRQLAGELEFIAGQNHSEVTAIILSHHKIKSTSRKLRK